MELANCRTDAEALAALSEALDMELHALTDIGKALYAPHSLHLG